ncbi:MAG: efflux RND transporter periplasmic adaptor subunit [Pseudomonadota bacterium]
MRIAAALLLCLTLAAAAVAEPPAVTYRSYAQVALYPERDAPATAVSDNESRIAAEISATIVAIPVEVAQVVAKGAVVARLDCRDYELAVHKAQAAHDSALARARLAQAQLKRAAELHRQAFISAEALSQRETEYAVQQADVKLSRAQLDTARHNRQKCILRAPFPAIVKARPGQVGELAAPGTPLLVLVGVFVIDGGRARFVPLPQAQEGRPAPAPLPPEAKIVIDGRHGLQDGQAFSSVR